MRAPGFPRGGHHLGGIGSSDFLAEELESFFEIQNRIDAGHPATAQQGVNDGGSVATFICAEKEKILPRDRDGNESVLCV